MQSPICAMLGIEFPLLAFSHCRDVVVAVSKAGGMGVFGAASLPPERLEEELAWIDDHIGGRPYGVDLIVPNSFAGKGEDRRELPPIPDAHKAFVAGLLSKHGVDDANLALPATGGSLGDNMREDGAAKLLEVAFRHPIGLIANALGVPPQLMLDLGKQHNVPVAALVGTRDHALTQVRAGVDILVVAGGEAGGHCGEIATMVLVPEVVEAVGADALVLAAGGIATGRQMAAAIALGADGVWTGSVWLTTAESDARPEQLEKYLAASSSDTVRSKSYTGKPARMLRTAWTDAWEEDGAPPTLPMPLQNILISEASSRFARSGRMDEFFAPVGQVVGQLRKVRPVRDVVFSMIEDYLDAIERLNRTTGE